MTLQELLDQHGVARDAVWHLEDPEISDETFTADVGLEWAGVGGYGAIYRIGNREGVYALVKPDGVTLVQRSEEVSEMLIAATMRASDEASVELQGELQRLRKTELKARPLARMWNAVMKVLIIPVLIPMYIIGFIRFLLSESKEKKEGH